MRYFVTGGTGFIGGHLVRRLRDAGHGVVALVRDPARGERLRKAGVKLVPGDVTDRRSVIEGMKGCDGVFHVAGWYKIGAKDISPAYTVNVEGTRTVLTAMKELGIKKGVYTSTLAVFSDTRGKLVDENYRFTGRHLTEYDRTKWLAHYEVAEPMIRGGLPLVIVLPGLVYGPGDTSMVAVTIRQYLEGKLSFMPLKTAYCWAHVEDVARAHILAMQKGKIGESYIIAGEPADLQSCFALVEKITGVPMPGRRLSPWVMRLLAAMSGIAGRFVDIPPMYRREFLRINGGVTYLGSNAKARKALGYEPRTLEKGLADTLSGSPAKKAG
jgi:nucleoside-diphosphate-sugar epimerase